MPGQLTFGLQSEKSHSREDYRPWENKNKIRNHPLPAEVKTYTPTREVRFAQEKGWVRRWHSPRLGNQSIFRIVREPMYMDGGLAGVQKVWLSRFVPSNPPTKRTGLSHSYWLSSPLFCGSVQLTDWSLHQNFQSRMWGNLAALSRTNVTDPWVKKFVTQYCLG